MMLILFFFFKQKTAYELRISDWSSDVCSSDLNAAALIVGHNHPSGSAEPSAADRAVTARLKQSLALVDVRLLDHFVIGDRSEEHTSELQSLMRISYAVFCLKKNNKTILHTHTNKNTTTHKNCIYKLYTST